jgi:hypothetical protein
MPTTTASKSGLRAKATATRTKAAQNTPLPAKDHAENVALAREAVAERVPTARETFTERAAKRVPQSASKAQAAARAAQAKAALGTISAKPGTPEHQEAQIAAGMDRKRARRASEDAKPPVPVAAPDDKAAGYVPRFAALGWETTVVRTGGLQELTATRGIEAIFLSWNATAHISGGSTYTYGDRTVKVRNPAEALRMAARLPDDASASQAKVSGNKMFRRRPTGPKVGRIPFNPETATRDEIAAALESHRISWHNQYRVESETAIVGRADKIQISSGEGPERIVSFVDPESGFRAFRLGNLETVGRKVDLEKIRQDILKSLTRELNRDKAKAKAA